MAVCESRRHGRPACKSIDLGNSVSAKRLPVAQFLFMGRLLHML